MAQPSKESILALRRFLASVPGQDIINSMRSSPPRATLDPAVHVYAHQCGVREGYFRAIDELENFGVQDAPQRTPQDRLDNT